MKNNLFFVLAIVLFCACRSAEKKVDAKPSEIISVVFMPGDTIKFEKDRLLMAKKVIPQFSEEFFQRPDEAYATRGMGYEPQNKEEKEFNQFSCEVCKDDYYLMYAYFLKQRNSKPNFDKERQTLIAVFRLINELNGRLQTGGTYFAHQHQRIYAYAAYAVYVYDKSYYDEKSYPITKEKSFFIGGLKQKVLDDELYNFEEAIETVAKKQRREELLKIIGQLDKLITDGFYLAEAQKFQYSNY